MRVACIVMPHLQAGADKPHHRRLFTQVVDTLSAISDRVEAAPPGTVYVRLDGLEQLYGGETQLLKALLGAFPNGLDARLGVAGGKFPAWVAARSNAGVTVVPGDVASFLAPYPVDLLPVPAEVRDGLVRFGLTTLGRVAALQEGQLLDQFGVDGRRAFRLCRGIDDRPVVPLRREEPVAERLSLPFPTTTLDVLHAAVGTLLHRAWSHPRLRGRRPERADLECSGSDTPPWTHTIHFKETIPDWERAAFILNHRVDSNPPPAPVEAVELTLSGFTPKVGVQLSLLPTPDADRESRLLEAERCLRVRMQGRHALYRVVTVAPGAGAPRPANPHRPGEPGRPQACGLAGPGSGAPAAAMAPASTTAGPSTCGGSQSR